MQRNQRCIVDGCPNHAHAKGYCRRHYGQMWRRGMIYEPGEHLADRRRFQDGEERGDVSEDLRRAEHELEKARAMYDAVVGFEGRMKWRKKIAEAQEAIRILQAAQVQTGAGVRG